MTVVPFAFVFSSVGPQHRLVQDPCSCFTSDVCAFISSPDALNRCDAF